MTDWASLEHAYGSAADVPDLLKQLSPDADGDVWTELWSRLCHQGTIYSASLAALPELIATAELWPPARRVLPIALAASILAATVHDGARESSIQQGGEFVSRLKALCSQSLAAPGLSKHEH